MTKDEKIFNKFKKKYSFIFDDLIVSDILKNHFDKKGTFIVFVIAFLQNVLPEKRVYEQIKINKDEWVDLFLILYKNKEIIDFYNKLKINPIIPLEQIVSHFDFFNDFIDNFLLLLKQHENNLNIDESVVKNLIKANLGYLLYNSIECKISNDLRDILIDLEYDTKFQVILNNTKLFSKAKQYITDVCSEKINELIVLILGASNSLTK